MQRTIYYESRSMPALNPTSPQASDIARHLQSRQFLGLTIVICDSPTSMLSAMRKQWLRLARNLQKQRASTLNAEEILRFTHTIMHMQHLQFVAKPPLSHNDAHIFFTTADTMSELPPSCLSLYVATSVSNSQIKKWLAVLANDALVVDYHSNIQPHSLALSPKKHLEERMLSEWKNLQSFMKANNVYINHIASEHLMLQAAAIDTALDSLLNVSNEFLKRAASFQHILSLAQPLNDTEATKRKQFEIAMRLAHRVQALTPGAFGNYLIKNFGEKNAGSFFLRDAAPELDSLLDDDTEKEDITYHDMEDVPLTTENA